MDIALSAVRLTRFFGNQTAAYDVSLDVPQGAMYGLVGPNGAGKTTTMDMMSGLLRPSHGTAVVCGHDMWSDPVPAKAALGVLVDGPRMFDRLSGRELITYHGRLRGVDPSTLGGRVESLLTTLGLADDATKLVANYSAGMRKKVSLACALVHAPKVLLLDEPFEAVDPVSAQVVRGLLEDYRAHGGTVVLSSHVMELVETLCDHVAVMSGGRLIAAGPVGELRGSGTLHERFMEMVGGPTQTGDLSWLHSSQG